MNIFLFQGAVQPAGVETQAIASEPASVPEVKEQPQKQSAWTSVGFMVLLFIVLYFLMIRPNQKREKQRKQKLASLAESDKVITIGGIKGTVTSLKEDSVIIKSKGTEIEVMKAAISHIVK